MARAILILAATVDVAVAVLLIALSGFVFGAGPEAGHDARVAAGWSAMLAFCLVAPVVGFAMQARGRAVGGILVAWLPPVVALFAVSMPPPY